MSHEHEIVDFKYQHLIDAGFPLKREWVAYQKYPSWSLLCDGRLVVAGGIITPHTGLAEAWAIPAPLATSHTKTMHRTVKESLGLLDPRIRRVQALVMQDHAAGHRWAERLGFEMESVMPKYGPNGETLTVYVMFPGEN